MKYLVIPDVHGRDKWKPPCQKFLAETDGHIVFLGDYNDSWDVKDAPMLDNFIDIILLKETHPDRVTLLLGNHCFPYLSKNYYCSGHRDKLWGPLNILYAANIQLFQVALQVNTTLFAHAGISSGWLEYNAAAIEGYVGVSVAEYIATWNYAGLLNYLFMSHGRDLLWQTSIKHGGYDAYDSPLWVRPQQLLLDPPDGLHQVVGHTMMRNVVTETGLYSTGTVTFCDTMGEANYEHLILEL